MEQNTNAANGEAVHFVGRRSIVPICHWCDEKASYAWKELHGTERACFFHWFQYAPDVSIAAYENNHISL